MKKTITQLFMGTLLVISIQAHAEVFDGIGKPMGKSTSDSAQSSKQLPPNHPAMNNPGASDSSMQADMKQPEGPVSQGKVVEVTNGAGYSYLLLESGGAQLWIAGTQIDAKKGDVVSYIENVAMDNFTSKTLNKTFDHIIFASSVKVLP